jgi:hypothetical protein
VSGSEPNGHAPAVELVDPELERMLVAAVLAEPGRLSRLADFAAVELGDPHARMVFGAIRNVQARGETPTQAAVRAQVAAEYVRFGPDPGARLNEHPQLGDLVWFDRMAATALPSGELPVFGWSMRILDLAIQRRRAVDEAEALLHVEDEITEFALRDMEPSGEPPPAPAEPRARWCTPLTEFLGDQEPDDDDSTDWIMRDILPRGEAGIVAGPPKSGKTWAMLDLAICVALGLPWLDTFDNTMGGPAKVLALAFEDGPRRLRKRVWELSRRHGLNPNDKTLQAHLSVSREPLALPGDERALAAELKRWKPQLVLIDNLTRVMAGDQNAIKDAKKFSDLWCRLCTDVGAAIVFLHHTNKVGPIRPDQRNVGDPFELIRGSGDLVASARHLVLMRPLESPDDDKLADVRMRGNLDLVREDFVFSFARQREKERWVARLGFRGDGEVVRDEIEDRRKAKAAERKAAKVVERGMGAANTTEERLYAKIAEMDAGGARDLCTLEYLKQSCGIRRQEVPLVLDRLLFLKRIRTEAVKRFEGTSWRSRAIFVPVKAWA